MRSEVYLREDERLNHGSPIDELQVQIPTMFFSGGTAKRNEIDELLTERFYLYILIPPSMSVPAHRLKDYFVSTLQNFNDMVLLQLLLFNILVMKNKLCFEYKFFIIIFFSKSSPLHNPLII